MAGLSVLIASAARDPSAYPTRADSEERRSSQARDRRQAHAHAGSRTLISVILCTHNPRRQYLDRALAALTRQTLPRGDWEIVVVDNASETPVAATLDLHWHPLARIYREDTLGLTHARLRGIAEAVGEILVFVDDDNVLDDDYLDCVRAVAASHEFLGAWSGSVRGEFDEPPPEWTRRYWTNLVIREVSRDRWSNIYGQDDTTPLGAGLCVRKAVAQEYARLHEDGLRMKILDRAGPSLVSGGDNDLAACAIDLGFGCGVMASLRLAHLIPNERLTEEYLLRLLEGIGYSSRILESYRPYASTERAQRGPIGKAADVLRLVRMSGRDRRFQMAARRGKQRAESELSG